MGVRIGTVGTFAGARCDKAQAAKVLEEAAEVYAAWQEYAYGHYPADKDALLDECADLIQATCNLLAAMGLCEFDEHMAACRRRNEARGREYSGPDARRSAAAEVASVRRDLDAMREASSAGGDDPQCAYFGHPEEGCRGCRARERDRGLWPDCRGYVAQDVADRIIAAIGEA